MTIKNSYINLEQIRFYAFHGVLPQERCVGTYFIVSLHIRTNNRKAIENDTLQDTINYAEVYDKVKEEMEIPSQLIEHAAGRILNRLYLDFPSIEAIDITLNKENPPMGAQCNYAGVELHTER